MFGGGAYNKIEDSQIMWSGLEAELILFGGGAYNKIEDSQIKWSGLEVELSSDTEHHESVGMATRHLVTQ